MTVKRREDGSVEIRSEDGSVRVISSTKGIHTGVNKKDHNAWLDQCATLITAKPHSFKEMEQYFLDQCDAVPIPSDDKQFKSFMSNIIMSFHKDKLQNKVSEFSIDMTDEEIEKWHQQETAMRQEIRTSSPERFGLVIRGYTLPRTQRNAAYYIQADQWLVEEVERMNQRSADRPGFKPITMEQMHPEDIRIFFEETSEQCNINGSMCDLIQKLIEYRGVTQEDIDTKSPRFMMYVTFLRQLGKLPGFPD